MKSAFIVLLFLSISLTSSFSISDLGKVLGGVLEGIGAETKMTSLVPCLKDSETIGLDIENAIKSFMKKDISDIKIGLKLLGEALETLPDAMTQCGAAVAETKKIVDMLKSFKSPWSFVFHVGKDLIVNGVQIYHDIENVISAFHSQNWEQVGFNTGHALAAIFIGTQVKLMNGAKVSITLEEMKDIFVGVLQGIGSEANLTAIETCIGDVTTAAGEIIEAVGDFIKADEADVKAGLKLLGEAIELLPDAMTQCEQAVQDAERLAQMIANFKDPWSFVYHVAVDIIVNGVQIYEEINAAIQDYQAGNWRQFGYDCGYALALVLLGEKKHSFQMQDYDMFRHLSNEEFTSKYLGLSLTKVNTLPRVDYKPLLEFAKLPDAFDSRTKWPGCIHEIRNQMSCGSCWAFAGSETLSDRFCIASQGKVNVVLSPQFMVSCDTTNYGCHGGILPYAWEFLENTGTVSDSCLTYHSFDGSSYACSKFQKCEDNTTLRHYLVQKGSSKTFANVDSIKMEIMTNGPVETGFEVYENFRNYSSGVYEKGSNPGKLLGGHAVKIVGWGVENGKGYWICANSWSEKWGIKGFFHIKFNECGIDSDAVAGLPDFTRN